MIPLSVLDLAPVVQGSSVQQALRNSLELARHAERWGYNRIWLAEHHNMAGIASAATAVLIGEVAAATETIRVGAGGIMLPNHSPLVVAEQFGTLKALHPGRIDLGLGRAPGTDQLTMLALRRDGHRRLEATAAEPPSPGRTAGGADTFPQDVQELQYLLGDEQPGQAVRAIPGMGSHVPIWILGSSLYGAQLAAALGLPYAFASHFAPDALIPALEIYRERYQPSERWPQPYAMVACNVICAATDDEARRLFTSQQRSWTNTIRGRRGQLPPPIDDIESYWTEDEKPQVMRMLARSFVGAPATVRAGLDAFVEETGAAELIVATAVHDHAARLRSYELLATVRDGHRQRHPGLVQ